jgi:hypothetical protein
MNKLNDSVIEFLLINGCLSDALALAKQLNVIQHPLFNRLSTALTTVELNKQQELFKVFYQTLKSSRKVYVSSDLKTVMYYAHTSGWQFRKKD